MHLAPSRLSPNEIARLSELEEGDSSKMFKNLQTHMLAFESAVARLEELARETEQLNAEYKNVTLAGLIREARTPADIAGMIKRQLQDLEDQDAATIQTRQFAAEEIQQIRKLCPMMRSCLEKEMVGMVDSIYRILSSTHHWSVSQLAERRHGRMPSPDRIGDIIEDLNLVMTWRVLSIQQEKFCKNNIQYLKARKVQLRIVNLLEINLMMAVTHQSSEALRHDSDLIKSLVFGAFDATGSHGAASTRDGGFYFDPITGTFRPRQDGGFEIDPRSGLVSPKRIYGHELEPIDGGFDVEDPPDGPAKPVQEKLQEDSQIDRVEDRRPPVFLGQGKLQEDDGQIDHREDSRPHVYLDWPDADVSEAEGEDEADSDDDDDDFVDNSRLARAQIEKRRPFRARRRHRAVHAYHRPIGRSALKKSGGKRKTAASHISFTEDIEVISDSDFD